MTNIIQSIQPFLITVTTATTAGTAAITAVDTAKSFIIPNGMRFNSGVANNWQGAQFGLVLTSSVLVTANADIATATSRQVAGTVIEFANFVNSIQTGVITVTSATTGNTATITAVSTCAFAVYQGCLNNTPSSNPGLAAVSLVNSTQVLATVAATSLPSRVYYAVVDLTSDIVETVEKIDLTVATTSTVDVATIASIDMGRTIVLDGGQIGTTVGAQAGTTQSGFIMNLSGVTSVEFRRASSIGTVERRHFATVVQFAAQALASTVQRFAIQMTSASTLGLTTIAAVGTRAFLNFPYSRVRASTAANLQANTAYAQLASTVVTATRYTTVHNFTYRFEVAEFASSINLGGATTSVGSGLVYGNLLSGHVRSPVNRAHYIMQGSV
jgi:hypothetical protein